MLDVVLPHILHLPSITTMAAAHKPQAVERKTARKPVVAAAQVSDDTEYMDTLVKLASPALAMNIAVVAVVNDLAASYREGLDALVQSMLVSRSMNFDDLQSVDNPAIVCSSDCTVVGSPLFYVQGIVEKVEKDVERLVQLCAGDVRGLRSVHYTLPSQDSAGSIRFGLFQDKRVPPQPAVTELPSLPSISPEPVRALQLRVTRIDDDDDDDDDLEFPVSRMASLAVDEGLP